MKLLAICFVILFSLPIYSGVVPKLDFGDECDEKILSQLELNGKKPLDISTINYKEYIDYSVTFEESKNTGFSKYFCSPKLFAKSTVMFVENNDLLSSAFEKLDSDNNKSCKGVYKQMAAIDYYVSRKENTFLSKHNLSGFNDYPPSLEKQVSEFIKYIEMYKEFHSDELYGRMMSICVMSDSEYRVIKEPKDEFAGNLIRVIHTDFQNFPINGVEIFW